MTSRNSSNIRSFYGPLLMSRQVGMNSGTSLSYKLQQLLHLLRSPHRETWTRLGLLLVLRLAGSLEASRSLSSLFCRLITCRTYYQISFVSSFYPLPRTNHLIFILVKGFTLFGWWFFGRRRFIFFADKDLGQIEVSRRVDEKMDAILTLDHKD